MNIMERFKEILISSTKDFGLPKYIKDVDEAISILLEFMPPALLEEYCSKFMLINNKGFDFQPIYFCMPVSLLIAGDELRKLTETQNIETVEKLKVKFLNIRLVDSQLSDLLAEIEVASIVGSSSLIELDAKTGVVTDKGEKDADIEHLESGVYFEVKNFEFGKTKYEKSFSHDPMKYFLHPTMTGSNFKSRRELCPNYQA